MCSAAWSGGSSGQTYYVLLKYQPGPFSSKSEKQELKLK